MQRSEERGEIERISRGRLGKDKDGSGSGMSYDVIGDIHGQAEKLFALLRKLGYTEHGSAWQPPQGRQAIFLGDLIDSGPGQVQVVQTVRAMIDPGNARSVMGNHEYNAIGYATRSRQEPERFLREHSAKNRRQHAEFLRQVGEGSRLHQEMVEWFRTLPPTLDLGGIRVVHAWWHPPYVEQVAGAFPTGVMPEDFLHAAYQPHSPAWDAMEGLTKGREIELPPGFSFRDHTGVERHAVRTRWWHENPRSYRDVALLPDTTALPDLELPPGYAGSPVEGTPVFIGHYWMSGPQRLQTPRLACLDYSAARDGPLVAYRWDGEAELDPKNFVAAG